MNASRAKVSVSVLAVVTGTAFGQYRDHFRIALTVPDEEIEPGLKKICEALK
jgi:aspartate/methionine/tyrosine aminotransferase